MKWETKAVCVSQRTAASFNVKLTKKKKKTDTHIHKHRHSFICHVSKGINIIAVAVPTVNKLSSVCGNIYLCCRKSVFIFIQSNERERGEIEIHITGNVITNIMYAIRPRRMRNV